MQLRWAPPGRPASAALLGAVVAAKAGDPLAPVTVVVPSNHVGVAARRLLASGALGPVPGRGVGIAAVTFLTVYRLAELLGSTRLAARGLRPVSTPVVAAALRAELRAAPGIFAPVADHPATEAALVAAYKELRDLSGEALDELASRSGRAGDVVRLHRGARVRLEAGFFDEEDLMAAAVEELSGDQRVLGALGPVVVHLPRRLSRHAVALLRATAVHSDVTVIGAPVGDPSADADVLRSIGRLVARHASDGERGAVGAAGAPGGLDPLAPVSVERTRVVTTSDADEEVRVAVRAVVDAARTGVLLERIAVLFATPEPYARLVHEQLSAAGVVHNGAAVVPSADRVAGRTLLGLLALPDSGFRREDVFAWLAGASLRHEGREVPVGAWERLSRDAGVVSGRDWDDRLASHADRCDADAERSEADPDTPRWRSERLRTDAVRARSLRRFVLGLVGDLGGGAAPRPWSEHAAWARGRLRDLLGGERRREGWPLVEQKAAERLERSLDRLARLGAVEGPVPLDVFRRTLGLELESDLGRVGRIGEGVLTGSVRMGVGLDLDVVVVLGLAEGSFPAPTHDDSLLPDHERSVTGGELALRADEPGRQRYELLATLAGSTAHVLCVPRGDLRRSNERVPSRWVGEIAGRLAGAPVPGDLLHDVEAPWHEHVASYAAGLRGLAFPATAQEHRLRVLLGGSSRTEVSALGDPALRAGFEVVRARRSARFTRFDGNLAAHRVPSPADGVTSATRLEAWAGCPFGWFVQQVLRVEPVENPEDRLTMSPLDFGSLVHQILEQFVLEALDRPPPDRLGPGEAWSEADRDRLRRIADEVFDEYEARGLVGRPIFWRRDRRRILADLDRFVRLDNEHRVERGMVPAAAELSFGLPGSALGSVELALPDGRSIRFRGKADRLDVGGGGALEVLDYKTGSNRRYAGLSAHDPDAGGTRFQLAVYALAARQLVGRPEAPVRAEYWFVSERGEFRRVGYDVDPEILERVGGTASRVVAGIEAGVFPHRPTTNSSSPFVECPYCDPDGLGVTDLHRRLARKRADPALASFLALVEGDGEEADGG